ncbi:BMP family ABC transporter substrate-binding protein [Scopulibacillus darangshiensis]
MLVVGMLLSACGSKDSGNSGNKDGKDDNFTVAMVTDTGGVDDKSFNQSAWEGLKAFGKKNDMKVGKDVKYLQSTSQADYAPNLNQLIHQNYDLVYGIGYLMESDVKKAAEQNPDAQLAIVDSVVTDDNKKPMKNVASITFKEQQGSFLVGVVAGMTTKSKKIGFIGGIKSELIKKFESGFKAGVKTVNPDAKIFVQYAGDFNAPDKGQAIAATMYGKGADIIYHSAGATGNGVFTEAKTRKKNGENVWVIGVDRDQYEQGLPEDVTLTSMVKRVDNAVTEVSKETQQGKFPGGKVLEFGLKDNGVGITTNKDHMEHVSADELKKVEEYKNKIINGEIKAPKTDKEYDAYLSSLK